MVSQHITEEQAMTPTDFRYTNLKTRLQAFAAERPHAHITKLQQEQWQAIAQVALEQQIRTAFDELMPETLAAIISGELQVQDVLQDMHRIQRRA